MSLDSKQINGYVYDHGDLTATMDGEEYDDFKEVKYSTKREIGKHRGSSAYARGRTRGTVDFEGSVTMLKSVADAIIKKRGPGWMEKEFDLSCVYGQDGQELTKDELIGCTVIGEENSTSEGAEALMITWNLDIKAILRNGQPPMKGMKL